MNGQITFNDIPQAITQLFSELQGIKQMLETSGAGKVVPTEIIDRAELCSRLNVTQQTVIKWEKKNKIPVMQVDSVIRYNWQMVLDALQKQKKTK